jgi:hypothetical protein
MKMRSKLIGVVLCVAVAVGLVMVPAAPAVVADGTVTIEVDPALTQVLPGGSFSLSVIVGISAGENVSAAECHLNFSNTYINVTGVTPGNGPTVTLKNVYSNAAGTIDFAAGSALGEPPHTADFYLCNITCTAKAASGTSGVDFVYIAPQRKTQVLDPSAVDYLTNWATQVTNGTVTVGTPQLIVNVTPQVALPSPPYPPGAKLAMGGIGIGYNITWSAGPGSIPLNYSFVPFLPNATFPCTTNWSWGEWLILAGADMIPGWSFNTSSNFIPLLGPMLPGAHYVEYMGMNITIYPMVIPGMNTLTKSTTAPFAQLAPAISILPPGLSFECFEGTPPAPGGLFLWNSGGGTLNWSAATDVGWLGVSPTGGNLVMDWYAQQNQTLVVSVNVTGLSAGTYSGNVTVSGASNVTIPVGLVVKPATAVDSCRDIIGSGDSGKPGETTELYAGETFDVYVNFTAPPTSPANGFNAIGVTDTAPDGWDVTVNKSWCWVNGAPSSALKVNAIGNKAEIMLAGPYATGTNISVMYKVTVPTTATPGINTWEMCPNKAKSWLEYYFNEDGPYTHCRSCENSVVVTQPGDLVGETRQVNSAPLPDVDVRLHLVGPGYLRSDISTPLYVNTAWVTGTYWMTANLTRFYELDISDGVMLPGASFTIGLTTQALLSAGYTFDFEGDYGLIPRACTMSYALSCINLWKIGRAANPEWDLSEWKAMDVCNSWLYPS